MSFTFTEKSMLLLSIHDLQEAITFLGNSVCNAIGDEKIAVAEFAAFEESLNKSKGNLDMVTQEIKKGVFHEP